MKIRKAKLTDASSLAALSIEVWLATYIKRGINTHFADYALHTFTKENFEHIVSNPAERIFVSDNEEGIDGYVRISDDQDSGVSVCSNTEIVTLYVQSRHHGKGIGKALLTTALENCAQRNILKPWLAVNSENLQAVQFYHANGFEKVGQTHFTIDDQAYLNEIMAINL